MKSKHDCRQEGSRSESASTAVTNDKSKTTRRMQREMLHMACEAINFIQRALRAVGHPGTNIAGMHDCYEELLRIACTPYEPVRMHKRSKGTNTKQLVEMPAGDPVARKYARELVARAQHEMIAFPGVFGARSLYDVCMRCMEEARRCWMTNMRNKELKLLRACPSEDGNGCSASEGELSILI